MKFKTCCTLPEKAPFTGKTANITPSVPFRIFPFRTEPKPRIPLCAACFSSAAERFRIEKNRNVLKIKKQGSER